MFTYPKIGVGAVITNGNRILLILRGKEPEANKWSIPGGKVELFEFLKSATVREVKEEINVDVQIDRLLCTAETINNTEHWISVIYQASIVGGNPDAMEPDTILDLKWFPLDQLPDNMACFTLPAIEALQNNVLTMTSF